jgi:ATP-dependent Clp protease protease subunit
MDKMNTSFKKHKTGSPQKKRQKEADDGDSEEEYETESLITCSDNHIYFYGPVNTKNILSLIRYIKYLNNKLLTIQSEMQIKYQTHSQFDIYLHINSGGGYITDAFAAIDHIKNSQIPITSIVEGFAASAATFLSIVCHKREITSYSTMLIHQLSSEMSGTFEQMKDDQHNNIYLQNRIKQLYIIHSNGKLNSKKLDDVLKRDLMWNANKCLQNGLVDLIK